MLWADLLSGLPAWENRVLLSRAIPANNVDQRDSVNGEKRDSHHC